MATSLDVITNLEVNSGQSSQQSKRKRKRKIGADNFSISKQVKANGTRWKTLTEQQIYSSKLMEALRRVRNISASSSRGDRYVRETADRVLAVSAKGRTRWSRAMLLANRRLRLRTSMKNKHKKVKKMKVTGVDVRKTKKLPSQVRVLGRLVPGCRKISFPNLLDETTDYIAALEMQVRAMAALTSLLNGAGVSLVGFTTRLESNMS